MFRHRLRGLGKRSKVASGKVRAQHRRRHWVLEGLENRALLSGSPTIYTVDLTTDTGTGSDNKGDILYCITQANANTNTAGSEIEFDPSVFQLATQQSITLSATLELLETAGPEVIDGPGASDLKITGNDTVQVFSVSSDTTATLSGLTIWGGMTNQDGGGINNQGVLAVTSCTFNSNVSSGAAGGGIANDGTLTITNSSFLDNSAGFGGGIENEGALTVTGSQFESNTANFGGGIDNDEGGTATLTSTTLTSNSASSFGGGIFYSGSTPLTVTNCTLSKNTAAESGGGIYNEGDGHDGGNKLTIANSTLSDNSADGGSSSSGGGGLYDRGGTSSISGSTFSGNTAAQSGGGIFSNAGALTIMDSTLSSNTLSGAGAGGGLYENGGTLTVTNSTIAGNSAGGVGAGIGDNAGTLTSVNCTIADNSVGLNVSNGGTAILNNTIVATNTTADISGTVSSSSAFNLIGTGGAGGLTDGGNGNQVGVAEPELGALADNGGPTQTIALLPESPALNRGSITLAVGPGGIDLKTDQRCTGFARERAGTVDIGAFEVQTVPTNPAPTLTTISPEQIVAGYASPLTLTVTGSNFLGPSVVDWNSTALVTTDVSSTELTATIPASDLASQGSFPITVVNPGPGGGTSTAATFQVLAVPTSVYVNASYAARALGTVVTWTDGSKHTVGFDAFGTVRAGVTAVASGGTVHIAAGTYTESVSIAQNLTLAGAGAAVTTIQIPANFASSDEIAIASGVSVAMSGFTVHDGLLNGTGIADEGGKLSATDVGVVGFETGVAVQDHGAATITDSTISGNNFEILVGSSTSDTSTLTAINNNLAGDGVGVWNIQTSGTINATLNWWGNASGPTTLANPGGLGAAIAGAGNVHFNPWLGDGHLEPYDYLVFSTNAADNYVVTPIDGNTALGVTSGSAFHVPFGTIPGGGTLLFIGNGGTITINGEAGSIDDDFVVNPTSVQFNAVDGLHGTIIDFSGNFIGNFNAMTRTVDAEGLANDFDIEGDSGDGPLGALVGDSGSNTFAFGGTSDVPGFLQGNIQGGGSSTLDYSVWPFPAGVYLDAGTDGLASGVSGFVSGITAIIGSNYFGGNNLNAGTVPDVALTGGIGTQQFASNNPDPNTLMGTGAGDYVTETLGSSYTLTNSSLVGTFGGSAAFVDDLEGIKVANLVGNKTGTSTTFNVSGWTGTGSLTGFNGASVTASESADITLTNSLLRSGTTSMRLRRITSADLTVTATAANPPLTIDASAFSGATNLAATGTGNAILYGGSGGGTLTAAGSGNDILIGEAADTTLTDTGSGHNILIGGGAGGDTFVGGGNDILVSGTTEYDSFAGANIAALDAILAEWASGASYPNRIRTIKLGVRRQGFRRFDAFNSHTIQTDSNANALSDRNVLLLQTASNANTRADARIRFPIRPIPIPLQQSDNWFIVSSHDHVTKRSNETETII